MSIDELSFPFEKAPAPGVRLGVADGVGWVRQPLPFALDHVNCWVLDESDHREVHAGVVDEAAVIVDTGIAAGRTRALWREALGGGRAGRLLVTHFHPDHMGLAGELARDGTTVLGSAVERALAHRIWHIEEGESAASHADWYAANGLPASVVAQARTRGNGYRSIVTEPPAPDAWTVLAENDVVALGRREWRVLVGRGHAPDMLMLHDAAGGLLIAADQVLPTISPNVSRMPLTDDPDPLTSFLDSLEALRALPADTLVLPSHGLPFRGLHARLDALVAHHQGRLRALRDAAAEPVTAFELFPVLFRRELDAQQLSFALGETLAHLLHLERHGAVERVEGGPLDAGRSERWRRR